MDKLVDGWITGKINDSSWLTGGRSWNWMWEEDRVWLSRKVKKKRQRLKCTCKQVFMAELLSFMYVVCEKYL